MVFLKHPQSSSLTTQRSFAWDISLGPECGPSQFFWLKIKPWWCRRIPNPKADTRSQVFFDYEFQACHVVFTRHRLGMGQRWYPKNLSWSWCSLTNGTSYLQPLHFSKHLADLWTRFSWLWSRASPLKVCFFCAEVLQWVERSWIIMRL